MGRQNWTIVRKPKTIHIYTQHAHDKGHLKTSEHKTTQTWPTKKHITWHTKADKNDKIISLNISPREIPQNWERQTVTHRCGAQAHTKQDTIRWWWWWFCRHFRFVLLFRIYHFCRTRVERKHDRTCVVRLLLLLLQPLLCCCMVFTRRHVGKPPYPVYRSGVRAFPSIPHTMYTHTTNTQACIHVHTHTHLQDPVG